jgi:sterol desaturase/sphingolipid hydroxylase (fatty acid hydroxylase superfamily)
MSSAFCNWGIGEDREKHAGRIVEIVSAWEPRRKGMREKDGGSYVDKLLLGLLTIVFVVLKLTGVIAWSWLWALSPIWIPAAFILVVSLVAPLAVLGWRHWSDRKRDDGGGEQKRSEE